MRTTINLDDQLLLEAKQIAAQTGQTLTAVLEDAVREALSRRRQARKGRTAVRLPTVSGRGPRPGVDLDHCAALIDLMEEDHGPP
jgi:hypothetical protein